MFTDSHLHFDAFDEAGETTAVLERAAQAKVTRMIAIGGTDTANARAVRLSRAHPGRIYATVGYDRDEVGRSPDLASLNGLLAAPGVVAVGETWLDYHYLPETAEGQCRLLQGQLDLAREHALPVVVHSREAEEDTVRLLSAHAAGWRGDGERLGVLHCYTGGLELAGRLLSLGYYISFSGIVTFKRAGPLREVAAMVPDERLLIETDAPYLAPVPHRGRRNEPAYVVRVAEALAKIRDDDVEHIADTTFRNAARLFALDP